MKIAVSAQEPGIKSLVDKRFGRARHFVLYDTQSQKWSYHDNRQNTNAAMGSGISAGQSIVTLGADAVLTEHCGTWAFPILLAGDVDVYVGASGSVQEAIHAFESDQLTKLLEPNVAAGCRGEYVEMPGRDERKGDSYAGR